MSNFALLARPSEASHTPASKARALPAKRLPARPRITVSAGLPRVQASPLEVSRPGDRLEIEADRVADQVVRGGEVGGVSRSLGSAVQRSCAACSDDATCPTCKVQRSADPSNPHIRSLAALGTWMGMGRPLPIEVRDRLEPAFGYDFGAVRIHTDDQAAQAAGALGAKAFTAERRSIVFGRGRYAPHTQEGQRLLAHELTHVVQQGGATQVAPGAPVSSRGPITAAGGSRVQADFLDDVESFAGDVVDTAASAVESGVSAVSSAADTVSSAVETGVDKVVEGAKSVAAAVGTGVDEVVEGTKSAATAVGTGVDKVVEKAKSAASTVAKTGKAVGKLASDAASTVSTDAEKTRANLIAKVAAAKQAAARIDPKATALDQAKIESLNGRIGELNATAAFAIPFAPALAPLGEVLGEILGAIGAALLGASAAVILLIAIIILAIIALIYLLLRDTKKFPDTEAPPKEKPKDEPKDEPKDKEEPKEDEEPKGKTDDPPPPLPPLIVDCCLQQLQPEKIRIDKRHKRYGAKTITVHDGRAKHWRNIRPIGIGPSCDVAFLEAALSQNPNQFGPCLRNWIAAARARDATYGGQMGSDTAPNRAAIVKDVVENGVEINPSRYWGDAGEVVGIDIATGTATTKARVDGLPNEAHVIPQENKPT